MFSQSWWPSCSIKNTKESEEPFFILDHWIFQPTSTCNPVCFASTLTQWIHCPCSTWTNFSHTLGPHLCLVKDFSQAIISFLFSLITSSFPPHFCITDIIIKACYTIDQLALVSSLYPHTFLLSHHPLSSNLQHHLIQLITPSSFKSFFCFLTWNLVQHILLIFFLPIWWLLFSLLCWSCISPTLKCYSTPYS